MLHIHSIIYIHTLYTPIALNIYIHVKFITNSLNDGTKHQCQVIMYVLNIHIHVHLTLLCMYN